MLEEYYKILNCTESSTDEEIRASYLELRKKYQNDRFLEGEAGNEAARKLTDVQTAYDEISAYRKENAATASARANGFSEIDNLIKSGKINEAQSKLDDFNDRNAEWHYLQSVVFYKKNWINESKKQLEIAMQMDAGNDKYKKAYDKLCQQMNYNAQNVSSGDKNWNKSGNTSKSGGYEEPTEMMGGDSCMDFCCRMAICNALLNCCCNCR